MKNARKRYVICLTNKAGSLQEPLWSANTKNLLSEGDAKFLEPASTDDKEELFGKYPKLRVPRKEFPVITRRAVARRLAAKAGARWYNPARVVELGTFKREVRPVKHWNIVRTMARLDAQGKRIEPFQGQVVTVYGIEVREAAREQARLLTNDWAKFKEQYREHYKFTAVPVYVEGN